MFDDAADLLTPEGRWTRHQFARNGIGRRAHFNSPSAACFCVLGAIYRVSTNDIVDRCGAYEILTDAVDCESIAIWNDDPEREQGEVVAFLRKLAEAERAKSAA